MLWKDVWREIKLSFPRFLSILAIIALGVAFFIGIKAAGPSMIATSQEYFRENHLPHGQVQGTYGINQADLDLLAQVEVDWLPISTARVNLTPGDLTVKVYPLAKDPQQNFFKLNKGRWPQADNEIALDSQLLDYYQDNQDLMVNLGNWIDLTNKSKESADDQAPHLKQERFKVVGFVESPIYFERTNRGNESIDIFALSTAEAIQADIYTDAFFWDRYLSDQKAYESSWEDRLKQDKEAINKALDGRGEAKLSQLTQEAEEALAKQEAELEEASSELESGEEALRQQGSNLHSASLAIQQGRADLQAGQARIDQGWQAYQQGYQEYQQGAQEIAKQEQVLNGYEASYQEGLAQYQLAESLLNGGLAEIIANLTQHQTELESGLAALESGRQQLELGQATYESARSAIEAQFKDLLPAGIDNLAELESLINNYPGLIAQIKRQIEALQTEQADNSTTDLSSAATDLAKLEAERAQLADQIEFLLSQAGNQDETGSGEEADSAIDQATLDQMMAELQALDQEILEAYAALEESQIQENNSQALANQLASLLEQLDQVQIESIRQSDLYQTWQSRIQNFIQGKDALESGWQEYYSQKEQLDQASQELASAWQEIASYQQLSPSVLESASRELEAGRLQLESGRNALAAGYDQLAVAWQQLVDAQAQLEAGQASLAEGRQQLLAAESDYQSGQNAYQSASKEFASTYPEAQAQIESGQQALESAREDLRKLLTPEFLIKLSQEDSAYLSVRDNANQLNVISNIFPMFFLFIAVLVSFTTVKRMTTEQRNFMGTLKQLGFADLDILKKFVIYAGLATLLGTLIGLASGYAIFPNVILKAYNIMFLFDHPVIVYSMGWILAVSAIALATGLIPAIASPKQLLKESPASLLRPPAPRSGKKILLERISLIWRALSFKSKMTVRNLVRYKGRNAMTLLGVAGCTMLIVTGFGISNTISGIIDQQFKQIQTFDAIVILDEGIEAEEVQQIEDKLKQNQEINNYVPIYQATIQSRLDQITNQDINLIVPLDRDLTSFNQLVHLHRRQTPDQQLALEPGQIYISERLEEFVKSQERGRLPISYGNLQQEIPVKAVAENYIGHYMYMTADDYRKYMLEEPVVNAFYLDYRSQNHRQVKEALMNEETVLTVFEISDLASGIESSLGSLDLITIVLIVSAAGLAFVVLYNLTNINIQERMKELATIKVLGFYSHEVSLYIYDEILVLTLLGSGLGMAMGYGLTHFIMKTMQLNDVLFYPRVHLLSYLYSFLLTILFSAIVMAVMHRKIRHIDMVEALKAVE